MKESNSDVDDLLLRLAALASPHRLRIIAALHSGGRSYISQLARKLGISRPLLHLHLQKLEEAKLVRSQLELSPDGKALNFFELVAFDLRLTPESVAATVQPITSPLPNIDS